VVILLENSTILNIYYPRILGRLHHALPLSIVPEQDDHFDEWFYSNYIQLSCEQCLEGGRHLNFHEAYIWNHKYPHFQVISLLRNNIDMLQEDLVTFVTRAVSAGYYFHCYINEFYMPFEYQGKRHIIRDIMVHGYDMNEGAIYALGYKKDHHLGTLKIDVQTFLEGYQRVGDNVTWANDCYLYKLRSDIDYRFDVIHVMELLNDYLYSRNSSERFRGIAKPHEYFYGIEAVRHYSALLEQSLDEVRLSQVPTYILWEHKKIMQQRMKYIYTFGGGYGTKEVLKVMERYEDVVKKASTIRLLILKYNMNFDRGVIVTVTSEIEKLLQMETDILFQFYDILSENVESAATLR
jgi:hypothetical protein